MPSVSPLLTTVGLVIRSVVLFLIISAMAMFAIAAFSSGYAPTREMAIGIVIAGAAIGVGHGLWTANRATRAVRPIPESQQTADSAREGEVDTSTPLGGIVGAVVGMALALVMTLTISKIAALFRGPVIGVWELGTPRYARNQTMVDLGRAAAIFIIGCAVGLLLVRFSPETRGLGVGLIIGSAALGLFALLAK